MVSATDHVVLSPPTDDPANSPASETTPDTGYLCKSPRDAVETLQDANKDEEDPYLKPINVHERGAAVTRNGGTATGHVVHRGWGPGNSNRPCNLGLADPDKRSDGVATRPRIIASTRDSYVNARQQGSGTKREGCLKGAWQS